MLLLYITLLDYVFSEILNNGFLVALQKSSLYPANQIGGLIYPDDVVITCDIFNQVVKVLFNLVDNASKIVLRNNLKKTKS